MLNNMKLKHNIYNLLVDIQDMNIPLISFLAEEIRYSNIFKDIWGGWKD
jgi:hypothetical protein